MDSSLLSPTTAALIMWAVLLAHGIVHTLAPARTSTFYGVPEVNRAHCHVPVVGVGAHLLFNCAIVAWTIVVPFLDSSFVYDSESSDHAAIVRHQGYAMGASILALAHLWGFLNNEISKRGGSDVIEGLLFLMNSMIAYTILTEQKGAVWSATMALAGFCFGLLVFPQQLLSLLWRYNDKFFKDESRGPYLVLLYRGIGVALAQSVVLVTCLELNQTPVRSFGLSCIALTTGVLSLPFWNCNAAKISLTARHLAMGAAGAMISSFMILHAPNLSNESSQE